IVMRKILLMGAALSIIAATPVIAFAGNGGEDGSGHTGKNGGHSTKSMTIDAYVALAAAGNYGNVGGNEANMHRQTSSANLSNSYNSGTKGVSNQAQNAGANSQLQNTLALAYVHNPSNRSHTIGGGLAVALAGNSGGVMGNEDEVGPRSGWDNDDGTVTQSATVSNSYQGFNGVGQLNQNAGNNSLLQNSAAVAAVSPINGTEGTLAGSLAASGNSGSVAGNYAREHSSNASSTIDNGSFNNANGVINVNQNSGANSLMQNSTAVGTLKLTAASSNTLAGAVAVAVQGGSVYCNTANLANGSAKVNMDSSFNGAQGVLQASQNAGANSLIQNSVSVAAVR
ncbi:MAG TPA: hypothetical protein PLX84_07615, partial [Acidiphilium sp.]|nr:hypothetical protein [Acidiphilium sp.]